MKKLGFLGLVVLVLFIPAILTGCSNSDGSDSNDIVSGYQISGMVVDEDGNGISDLNVEFIGTENGYAPTDDNGNWSAVVSGTINVIPPQQAGIYAEPNFYKEVSSERSDLNFTIKREEPLVTEIVDPSSSDVSISYEDQITVNIPQGAYDGQREVSIYPAENYPSLSEDFDNVNIYAIGISELDNSNYVKTLTFPERKDIEVVFPLIKPENIDPELRPEEYTTGLHWDKNLMTWEYKPVTIDQENNIIKVFSREFSFIGHGTYHKSYDEKYDSKQSANFTISYPKKINVDPYWSNDVTKMADDILQNFEDALAEYQADNFKDMDNRGFFTGRSQLRMRSNVYESEWSWKTGIIYITPFYDNNFSLYHDSAHELFHAVQDSYYTFAGMASRRWWIEATADYAAAEIANSGNISAINRSYFRNPITYTNSKHEYQTARFIDYLVEEKNISFKELWDFTAEYYNSDVFEQIKTFLANKGYNFNEIYRDFAAYSFLSTSTSMPTNLWLSSYPKSLEKSQKSASFSSTLKANGTADLLSLEVRAEEDEDGMPGNRTLFITTEEDLNPGETVDIFITNSRKSGQPDPSTTLDSQNKDTVITVPDFNNVYFLLTNTNNSDTEINLKITALEEQEDSATIKVFNDTENLAPIHFSLDGSTGTSAPKIEVGSSKEYVVQLKLDPKTNIYQKKVEFTVSRSGVIEHSEEYIVTKDATLNVVEWSPNSFFVMVKE